MLNIKSSFPFSLLILTFCFVSPVIAADDDRTHTPHEQDNITVFKEVSPLVVNVHTIQKEMGRFADPYEQGGSGSGFIWDAQGHIVTNFHVIQNAKDLVVSLQNGQTTPVTVVGVEPRKDIAVLKMSSQKEINALQTLKLLEIGNSSRLEVGQQTIAIGNPFGLDRTMTTGIISALNRRIPGVAGVSIRDMIQTDASINPGNSGGPLLNSKGQLIGMNTVIFSNSGTSAGIGFAVPSNEIKRTVDQIILHGRTQQAGIGVQILGDSISAQLGIQGIIVAEVKPTSPAGKAGMRGTYRDQFGQWHWGDIITAIDQQPVRNYDDLYNLLETKSIGQTIQVTIERNGKPQTLALQTVDISGLEG